MTLSGRVPFAEIEQLTHQDPGMRRLAAWRQHGEYLDHGQLQRAAESLAAASSVAIVTGFATLGADPPAAETDGPPGALYLARALRELGVRVQFITDCFAAPVLAAGCRYWRLPLELIVEAPWQPADPQAAQSCAAWCRDLAARSDWTHLISIERPGLSHDLDSLRDDPIVAQAWSAAVGCSAGSHYYNMRGQVIDRVTAPLDRLFTDMPTSRRVKTIGLADGGNEIGIGRLSWQIVRQALADPATDRIICRVPTDWLLLAGVSNWAAYALAGAVCALRGRARLLASASITDHGRLIETLVRDGGAVDGVSGAREARVDGLPLDQYLAALEAIQHSILK